MNIEIQMEKLNGRLEKHIGITETILKNQENILRDIRTEMKSQNQHFISHEEAAAIHDSVLLEVERDVSHQLLGFEDRIDRRDKKRWSVAAVLLTFVAVVIQVLSL